MRVLLSGYYGFDNAGDEAVLYAILQALREKEISDITVLSAKPSDTEKRYGVKAVNRWGKLELVKAIRNCDVLISGGGSLLQDVTSKNGILYYLGIIRLAEMFHKKVIIYAQGIGPIQNGRNRSMTAKILNKTQAITVRDFESFQELQKMGVYRDIYVSSDPVIGIAEESIDEKVGAELLKENKNYHENEKNVMVSIRNWKGKERFFPEIATACDNLIEDGHQVIFVPFHFPEDKEAGAEIAAIMKNQPVVLEGNYSPEETMAILKNADVVVGMRLHSLIMGFVLQKPLVGISYDPKVTSFMQMIRQRYCYPVEMMNASVLETGIKAAFQNAEVYRKTCQQLKPIMAMQAKEPVELLLKM